MKRYIDVKKHRKKYVPTIEINSRLKSIRKELDLSQEGIALPIGYSGAHWNKIEKQNVGVKESFVIAVCRTYHVNYDYLVYGEGAAFDNISMLDEQILCTFSELSGRNKEIVLRFAEFITLNPIDESSPEEFH